MSLTPGSRLGPYEVVAPIGAGGMGEVHRARDPRLGRAVAIKVLPVDVAADAERLARFEREARLLAQLNHANIAGIYGLEEADGMRFIAMECVDGVSLADHIADAGPLDPDETVAIAAQIADALEAAHETGIVHRDLKPANVMITPGGTVKVLDFGLAKAFEPDGAASASSPDLTASPTMAAVTGAGVLMGTAAYMSPEQARGKPVDKRSDVWAFGCCLFEMLTGSRPFAGETVTDTLAAIVRAEPDWERLPCGLPAHLDRLARRCLHKDARQRLRDIGEARIALASPEDAAATPLPEALASWKERLALPALGLALVTSVIALAAAWPGARSAGVTPSPDSVAVRAVLEAEGPARILVESGFALSPDGDRLAFAALADDGTQALWLLSLGDRRAERVAGTTGAAWPFWSPDERHLGFVRDGRIHTLDLSTGAQRVGCPTSGSRPRADWSASGTILYPRDRSIYRTDPAGSSCVPASTTVDPALDPREVAWFPDGERYAFATGGQDVYVAHLDDTEEPRLWIEQATRPSIPVDGWVLFARNPVTGINEAAPPLLAQQYDPETLQLIGEPRVLLEQIFTPGGGASYTASRAGVLVAATDNPTYRPFVWVDRSGRIVERFPTQGAWTLDLAPDGRRLALGGFGLWVRDLERGITDTLGVVTPERQIALSPAWDAGGGVLSYATYYPEPVELRRVALGDGSVTTVWAPEAGRVIEGIARSPDGDATAFWLRSGGGTDVSEVWVHSAATGQARAAFPGPAHLSGLAGCDQCLEFSPDGRWLLYSTHESGGPNVFVRAYPDLATPLRISPAGGYDAHWSADGRTIYYEGIDGAVLAVDFGDGPATDLGEPRAVVPAGAGWTLFAVSPDGERFLRREGSISTAIPLRVLTNWLQLVADDGDAP